ncbi:hypothetical protein Btru_057191 [Bulinus truncatus]|nr:hypothetical protein Btru_057191 [Bulinus truncatus]
MLWRVLVLTLTLLPSTWLSDARRLMLDFLCTSEVRGHMYVRDLPWDCNAYVICMNGRAIHATCPHGYKYHSGHGYNRCVPIDSSARSTHCDGVIWNYIRTVCHYNPAATVPDAVKCSQYLDCSVHGTGHEFVDYLLECPYPTLYSTQTGACEHHLSVMCGERVETKAPCRLLLGHIVL